MPPASHSGGDRTRNPQSRSGMRKPMLAALCAAAGGIAHAQSVAARVSTPQEQALLTRLVAAEDARDGIGFEAVRDSGLASSNAYVRAYTVRGLGRLERGHMFDRIANRLVDASPEVRA